MVGVILAAGNGTRFGGSGCCKALKCVNGTTLIERALNNLVALGIETVCIVAGVHKEQIVDALGKEYRGISIFYAHQERQIGLIDALVRGSAFVPNGESVCLQLADEVFVDLKSEAIKRVISEMHADFCCGITMEADPGKIMQNYSVEMSDGARVLRCVEKPQVLYNSIKGTGLCFFRYETLELLRRVYDCNTGMPRDLCDFMNYLIAQGKNVTALCVAEREFNVNTPADLEEAEVFLSRYGSV